MEYITSNTQIFKHSLKGLVLVLLFFFTINVSFAQRTKNEKALKNFNEAINYRQLGRLSDAMLSLEKSIKADPNFLDAVIFKADILTFDRKYEDAKKMFIRAIAIDTTYSWAYIGLADVQSKMNDLQGARITYQKCLSLKGLNSLAKKLADKGLATCEFSIEAMKHPVPFSPINMGENINSKFDEYFPALTVDDATLLFTRRVNGENEDFFISTKTQDGWSNARNLGYPINTPSNEGGPSLSSNGQLLIYTACEKYGTYGDGKDGFGSCDLFGTQKKGESWTKPVNLGPNINTSGWESQPSFSADGKTLYFVRGEKKGGGDYNIYMSIYEDGKGWSLATKLSDVINTPSMEQSVMIHPDGNSLYFASDGHPGMGGLDLFLSKKDKQGNWTKPVNLGYPINTSGDENSLLVSANGKIAYFASDRPGGFGGMDLYFFEMPENIKPEPVTYMKGTVLDFYTKAPLESKFELIDLETSNLVVQSTSNPINGEFLVSLPSNREYALNVSKNGYLFYSENFELKKSQNLKPVEKNILLKPIRSGETVVLKNIFFETAKYNLEPKSKIELDKLIKFLESNPTTKIEIGGHTDDVGSDAANQKLSEDRAKSVYSYLLENKVNSLKITFKGYGESKPIGDNQIEEGRAQNRRTEFKIM